MLSETLEKNYWNVHIKGRWGLSPKQQEKSINWTMTKKVPFRILTMESFDMRSHEVPSSFIQTLINKNSWTRNTMKTWQFIPLKVKKDTGKSVFINPCLGNWQRNIWDCSLGLQSHLKILIIPRNLKYY